MQRPTISGPVEIERKYLLRGMPALPPVHETWRIEQGYFTDPIVNALDAGDDMLFGRIRRAVSSGGLMVCTHTVKSGVGVVRTEVEREISPELFERHWPRTAARRLRKTRYRVPGGEGVWEIDVFEDLDLVLAEIELPHPDAPVEFPAWLNGLVVREVTNEPAFTNSAIAARLCSA